MPIQPCGYYHAIHIHARTLLLVELQLGVCTVDDSSELNVQERIDRIFADPTNHCVGYGRLANASPKVEQLPRDGTPATVDAHVVAEAPAQYADLTAGDVAANDLEEGSGASAAAEAVLKAVPLSS